jgi:type II secretory pathway pseudopilin PulG
MRPHTHSSPIARARRRRAFTFIELLVAVALTVILMRGLLTVFTSATELSRLSGARTEVMLEAGAAYDFLAQDVARCPFTGDKWFAADANGAFTLLATERDGSGLVYIQYTYVPPTSSDHDNGKLLRSVYATGEPDGTDPAGTLGPAIDEDGDGSFDTNMVIVSTIKDDPSDPDDGWHVELYKANPDSGGFDSNSNWEHATGRTDVRAVRFRFTLAPPFSDADLRDQSFVVALPLIWM